MSLQRSTPKDTEPGCGCVLADRLHESQYDSPSDEPAEGILADALSHDFRIPVSVAEAAPAVADAVVGRLASYSGMSAS